MSFFNERFLHCVWVNIPRQPLQVSFLLLWFDVELLILELPPKFDLLLLCDVVCLQVVGDGHAVHWHAAQGLADVVDSHYFPRFLVKF